MLAYLLRRIVWTLFVLLGVMTIAFFLTRVIPADPIAAMLGPQAPPKLIDRMRAEWGLDQPIYLQYYKYLVGMFRGDLGTSIRTNSPVLSDLLYFFPATLELATLATFIAIGSGLTLGIIAAAFKDSWFDHFARLIALFGISMPVFWLAILVLFLFFYTLGWMPGGGQLAPYVSRPPHVTGMITIDCLLAGRFGLFGSALKHLVLPAVVLSSYGVAAITRITRTSMLEVMTEEYMKTARMKGLRESAVILKHALKNAMLPISTVIGFSYGRILEGSVITETIFAWPGLGRYATNSFLSLDFPAVVGASTLIALLYALTNLAVDITYAYLNPEVTYE